MSDSRKAHWDAVYARRALDQVSWYQERPLRSLELIRASGVGPQDPIIDAGGGASHLVDELLRQGYRDLTVHDISDEVLAKVRQRLGATAAHVNLLQADITAFRPTRRYALWHDRAVFHFLVDPAERARSVDVLKQGLRPDGHLIVATFGPEGPERCSGLTVQRYGVEALGAALGANFRLLDAILDIHRTPAGGAQQFLYCHFSYEPPAGTGSARPAS